MYNTILTRLRSDPLTSPQRPTSSPPQHHERIVSSPSLPVQQQRQQLPQHRHLNQHSAAAATMPQEVQSTSVVDKQSSGQNPVGHRAEGGMRVPVQHPSPAVKAAVVPEPEPDMSEHQAIASIAVLLESLAVEFEGKSQVQKGLSVRLLALQLLMVALREGSATAYKSSHSPSASDQTEAVLGKGTVKQQQQHQQTQQDKDDLADSRQNQANSLPERQTSRKEMQQMLVDIASKVEEAVKISREEAEGRLVPYVWQVVYEAALDFARTAAMQEVIGELEACMEPYSQVVPFCCLLTDFLVDSRCAGQALLLPSD